MAPDTIVLVHGFWMTPRSWEKWIAHYEAKGYTVIAPAYPGFEVEVEALKEDPTPIENLSIAGLERAMDSGDMFSSARGAARLTTSGMSSFR